MKNNGLFTYLCCPVCKGKLIDRKRTLYCSACPHTYAIKQGIPILINLNKLPTHLQKQIDYFEKEDQNRTTYQLESWQQRYIDNFLRFGKPKEKGIVIDNATGSGYMAIELARKGFRVIATDLTLVELIKLQKVVTEQKLESNILLVCCTSETLPIATSSADGLVANAILEHLPNEKEAIAQIHRVVKKDAPVMVAMPLAYHLLLPILWVPNWVHDKRIGHLRRYTRKRILDAFGNFREVRTYYTGHLPKVICIFLYLVTKHIWWNTLGEQLDKHFQLIPYGASNIVAILRKK